MGANMEGVESLNATLNDMADRWGNRKHVVYMVGTNVEYAPYMEFGTRPHVITGDPLVFTVNGQVVYTQKVNHPGTEPRPYMRPAIEAADRNLRSLAAGADSVEDFIRRVALFVEREAKRRAPVDTGTLRASIRTERVA